MLWQMTWVKLNNVYTQQWNIYEKYLRILRIIQDNEYRVFEEYYVWGMLHYNTIILSIIIKYYTISGMNN